MSLAKIKKSLFRDAARRVLEDLGLTVEEVPGRGTVPGSRLRASRANQSPWLIAVRSSVDREIAFIRSSTGSIAVPKVQQVVCAIPAADGSDSAEVLSFDPAVLSNAASRVLRT